MKKWSFYIIIAFVAISCSKVKLDAIAFPSTRLDSYEFEEYDAKWSSVPEEYDISPDNHTLITMTSMDVSTGETYTIYGVYIGDLSTISTDTVIMYCHGQALHLDAYWPRASLLANVQGNHNYGVFMMDYRGYGRSEGSSSEQGLYEDVDASIDWLKSKGADPSKTIYYGFSLGAIPVIDRAAYRTDFKPSKVIIEAPLASVENLANSSLILNVDPKYISSLEFNNAEKIKDVTAPLLWIHGVKDDYVEIENGELIYANYKGNRKEAVRVENGNHGDVPKSMGYELYVNTVEGFISE